MEGASTGLESPRYWKSKLARVAQWLSLDLLIKTTQCFCHTALCMPSHCLSINSIAKVWRTVCGNVRSNGRDAPRRESYNPELQIFKGMGVRCLQRKNGTLIRKGWCAGALTSCSTEQFAVVMRTPICLHLQNNATYRMPSGWCSNDNMGKHSRLLSFHNSRGQNEISFNKRAATDTLVRLCGGIP